MAKQHLSPAELLVRPNQDDLPSAVITDLTLWAVEVTEPRPVQSPSA